MKVKIDVPVSQKEPSKIRYKCPVCQKKHSHGVPSYKHKGDTLSKVAHCDSRYIHTDYRGESLMFEITLT